MDERPYWPRMAMAFLALGGLINATYLSIHRLRPTQSGPLVCGVVGNCEAVQASKYSVFPPSTGIPVAYIGLVGFLVLVILSVLSLQRNQLGRLSLPSINLGLASVALAFSAYFTAIEAWVLHEWCQWCIISAVVSLLFWALASFDWWQARRATNAEQFEAANATAV
ncbi:vitamin K epoxide reductase family protein [Herpetosiphon geysericola]|uniref:Vitamin K epoxide reductase domain-containing protein n=1 Tax=Herpetosiphon geysericola TaxID=70996 RepID=A0A0P6XSZ1_9CHLR|nr:vitamin K epoxide reductase family protein [Herpetosiphon geysericola]KPL86213.1 hypothetical protein SE18_15330 [Herpetosiphon geysericola]